MAGADHKEDTLATLTTGKVRAYWDWRRKHSIKTLKGESTVVVERGASDGTIIRELAGTLRPAIQHGIKQKRLLPGIYHVPVPQAPPGRDYWINRTEAAKLLRKRAATAGLASTCRCTRLWPSKLASVEAPSST
jgi:hypothetical protein